MNLSFLNKVREQRKDDNMKQLLDVGTCGLHNVHNSFKHGAVASGWAIDKILKAMYKIFDKAPGRRGDYEKLTKGTYPLQFCSHRWAENKRVADRAIDIWDDIVLVVNHWSELNKSQQPSPENKSYPRLKAAKSDPLLKTKLKFFGSIADTLNSFLVKFQTNNPMVPFLAESLEEIIRSFGSCFLLKETLTNANTILRLSKINFGDASLHKRPVDVDPGIGIKLELSALQRSGVITANQVLNFKRDVVKFLSKLCSHLAEKSPIKVALVRNARCFIPALLIESPESSETRFGRVLESLVTCQQISGKFADEAKKQFSKLLGIAREHKEDFLSFDPANDRLDVFYWKYITGIKSVDKLAEILKIVLTLSHGQAAVERGFSVNKSLLVENLSTSSLISQRIVHDHLTSNNLSSEDFEICGKLRKSVRSARSKYDQYLADKRKEKVETAKSLKRKSIQEDIDVVRSKKKVLEKTVLSLSKDADKYAKDAEEKTDVEEMKTLITKSNSLRKTIIEKENELKEYSGLLSKLVKDKENVI